MNGSRLFFPERIERFFERITQAIQTDQEIFGTVNQAARTDANFF